MKKKKSVGNATLPINFFFKSKSKKYKKPLKYNETERIYN